MGQIIDRIKERLVEYDKLITYAKLHINEKEAERILFEKQQEERRLEAAERIERISRKALDN